MMISTANLKKWTSLSLSQTRKYHYLAMAHNDSETSLGFYGGYQGWFSGDSSFPINIAPCGCGLIASNDVILYMNGTSSCSWGEYHDSVLETFRDYSDMQGHLNVTVPAAFAVSSVYVQQCLAYNGYYNFRYRINSNSQDSILNKIVNSLQTRLDTDDEENSETDDVSFLNGLDFQCIL